MIRTQHFNAPAEAIDHFNSPANASLRLVSLLPAEGGTCTAIYDDAPATALEEERLRVLEERILATWQFDDDTKMSIGVPRSIVGEDVVPLSIVNNRLRGSVCFRGMDTPSRAAWIRGNAPAVGCTLLSPAEAQRHYGCGAELLRIEA